MEENLVKKIIANINDPRGQIKSFKVEKNPDGSIKSMSIKIHKCEERIDVEELDVDAIFSMKRGKVIDKTVLLDSLTFRGFTASSKIYGELKYKPLEKFYERKQSKKEESRKEDDLYLLPDLLKHLFSSEYLEAMMGDIHEKIADMIKDKKYYQWQIKLIYAKELLILIYQSLKNKITGDIFDYIEKNIV